jgi:hypothetical protein
MSLSKESSLYLRLLSLKPLLMTEYEKVYYETAWSQGNSG